MRMSMAQEAAEAAEAEKMDVDEQSGDKGDEDYSEAMNDPAFLQVITIAFCSPNCVQNMDR